MHLAAELPVKEGGSMQVLYPASVKAGTDLQVSATTLLSRLLRHAEDVGGQ